MNINRNCHIKQAQLKHKSEINSGKDKNLCQILSIWKRKKKHEQICQKITDNINAIQKQTQKQKKQFQRIAKEKKQLSIQQKKQKKRKTLIANTSELKLEDLKQTTRWRELKIAANELFQITTRKRQDDSGDNEDDEALRAWKRRKPRKNKYQKLNLPAKSRTQWQHGCRIMIAFSEFAFEPGFEVHPPRD